MGDDSATGVAFTRNPGNGENKFYGEYLINAQGEDVVAGIRTPAPINESSKSEHNRKTGIFGKNNAQTFTKSYSASKNAWKNIIAICKTLNSRLKKSFVYVAMPCRETQRTGRDKNGPWIC